MNFIPRSKPSASFELSAIKAIELAAAKRPGVISLAQGIPGGNTPKIITDFVIEKIRAGVCDKYSLTTGLSELREEIALSLERDDLHYNSETEIIVTVGSIEGITASLLALTSPGDEVLVPSPTYASYLGAISLARCTPRFIELDEDNNFDFDVRAIERSITRNTRAILYCSPNNPTGTLYSEAKTRELLRLAERHNLTVLIDEVYKDFYYTSDKHFTPASLPEARSRVVRICSFSKAFAMTGWRVGFLHADQSLVQQILKYHDAMVTCAPVVSQYAAIAALRNSDTLLATFLDEYRARRNMTLAALDRMSAWLDYQTPKATYFAFPRVKDSVPLARDSTRLAYDILDRAAVAVVPGVAFGPTGESHLRICYGRERDVLETGLARLESYFSGARSRVVVDLGQSTPQRAPSSRSPWIRKSARWMLALAAKLFLLRNRPIVIGVAGTRGKTVFKRTILENLVAVGPARATILSYNTETGLPLSILNLKTPQTSAEKLAFPLALLSRALFFRDPSRFLVLEYGISTRSDAKLLRSICTPNWLILTHLSPSDPSLSHSEILAGIADLSCAVGSKHLIWPATVSNEVRSVLPELITELSFAEASEENPEGKCESALGAIAASKVLLGVLRGQAS